MKLKDPVNLLQVGDRVRVSSYSPFRGLKGIIKIVDTISTNLEDDEPFCFYSIVLEGAHVREPIWFEYNEVDLVASTSFSLKEARKGGIG